MGFVDGSIQPPPPHLSQESTSATIEPSNPIFLAWFRVDQTIQSWIMATLSPAALGTVLGLGTAHQMRSHFQHQFASNIEARLLQLKFELQHIKKGSLTMAEYLEKVKQIADDLAATGKPVDHDDLVFLTLGGLGSEFEPLAMTVTSRTTPVTIEELHTVLLTQEHRLSITSQMASLDLTPSSPATNLASRWSDSRGQGRGRGQGCGRGCGRGRHTNYNGRGNSSSSTMSASSSHGSKQDNRPQCQLCSKRGHTVHTCYHRFDQAFQPAPSPTATHTIDVANDNLWFPDSGASNHFTGDLSNL